MGDDWKLEAIKEQFNVLNSSRNRQQNLDTNDVSAVVKAVGNVLHTTNIIDKNKLRNISVQVINQHSGIVKFDYSFIVTNTKENGKLVKIPLLIIQHGNEKVFIDLNSFTYQSWDAFLEHFNKVLPNTDICFPVGGSYKNENKLEVNFKICNPPRIQGGSWGSIVKLGIGVAAATVLFMCKPLDKVTEQLIGLAQQFVPGFDTVLTRSILDIVRTCHHFTRDKTSILEALPKIFKILSDLHNNYKEDINNIKYSIYGIFKKVFNYIKSKFPGRSEPIGFLANANSINDENSQSLVSNNCIQPRNYSAQDIFRNCQQESVFSYNSKSKPQQLGLNPVAESLINISMNIVNESPKLFDNDLDDVLSCVKDFVYKLSDQKYVNYNKIVKIITDSNEDIKTKEECISAYHESLQGEPKQHFLLETLRNIENSPVLKLRVLKQCEEVKEKEPVLLIQIYKNPNNAKLGIYNCIGKGTGLVNPKSVIKAMSNMFNIDENRFITREEIIGQKSQTVICFGNFTACLTQNISESTKDSNGKLLIHEV